MREREHSKWEWKGHRFTRHYECRKGKNNLVWRLREHFVRYLWWNKIPPCQMDTWKQGILNLPLRWSHCSSIFVDWSSGFFLLVGWGCLWEFFYCPFYVSLLFRKTRINKQTSDPAYLRLKKSRGGLIISFLVCKYNNNYIVIDPWLLNIKETIYYKLSKSIILLLVCSFLLLSPFIFISEIPFKNWPYWIGKICIWRVLY